MGDRVRPRMNDKYRKHVVEAVAPILKEIQSKHQITYKEMASQLNITHIYITSLFNEKLWGKISVAAIHTFADIANNKIVFEDGMFQKKIDNETGVIAEPFPMYKYEPVNAEGYKEKLDRIKFWQALDHVIKIKPEYIEINVIIK